MKNDVVIFTHVYWLVRYIHGKRETKVTTVIFKLINRTVTDNAMAKKTQYDDTQQYTKRNMENKKTYFVHLKFLHGWVPTKTIP